MELQPTARILEPVLDSKINSNLIRAKDAKERNIPFRTLPPEPVDCQFCGAVLDHEGVYLFGFIVMWNSEAIRCTCERSKVYWEQYDAEKEREKREKALVEERDKKRAKYERLLGKSGIKERFQQRTFESFITDTTGRLKAFQVAKRYADEFNTLSKTGKGLYLEGPCGTGKTHLSAAIALQLLDQGVPVICKTSIDLLNDIKSTYDTEGESEEEVLHAYKTVDLLVIDDLGKEQCTDWGVSILYSIINDRYEGMKPTIVTTNYNDKEFIRALTPKGYDSLKAQAIISRLKEVSTALTMNWEDYRCGT